MSSAGELFVNELSDLVREQLNKLLKNSDWSLSKKYFYDCWDKAQIQSGEVEILDDGDKKIGVVEFVVKPYVEEGVERYIEIEIEDFKIKLDKKQEQEEFNLSGEIENYRNQFVKRGDGAKVFVVDEITKIIKGFITKLFGKQHSCRGQEDFVVNWKDIEELAGKKLVGDKLK